MSEVSSNLGVPFRSPQNRDLDVFSPTGWNIIIVSRRTRTFGNGM